jgi:hypothetical protein
MRLRRKRSWVAAATILAVVFLLLCIVVQVPKLVEKSQAIQAVEKFYRFEQSGNFGSSWEMFHSQMKQKFSKDTYIQRRAHVFMQDFGVKSFDLHVGHASTLSSWTMVPETPSLRNVVRIPVVLRFQSVFGNFDIHQEVYVSLEDDQWKILWSYQDHEGGAW